MAESAMVVLRLSITFGVIKHQQAVLSSFQAQVATAATNKLQSVPITTLVDTEGRGHCVGHVAQDFGRISLAIDVLRKMVDATTLCSVFRLSFIV